MATVPASETSVDISLRATCDHGRARPCTVPAPNSGRAADPRPCEFLSAGTAGPAPRPAAVDSDTSFSQTRLRAPPTPPISDHAGQAALRPSSSHQRWSGFFRRAAVLHRPKCPGLSGVFRLALRSVSFAGLRLSPPITTGQDEPPVHFILAIATISEPGQVRRASDRATA